MSKGNLKETIDRMVEDSIRRILPEVMNEVLLKMVARGGLVSERSVPVRETPVPQRQPAPAPRQPQRSAGQRPSSLRELLDPTAGTDFYQDPREAMRQATVEEAIPPRQGTMAQRIQNLPPMLREMAEETLEDDDGIGEMWGDNEFAPMTEALNPSAPNLNLDQASRVAGVDWSRARELMGHVEAPKIAKTAEDIQAEIQWKAQQVERERERLNNMKVG